MTLINTLNNNNNNPSGRSDQNHKINTYYTLLNIPQTATIKEIEKAYKKQALIHHPDRNPNQAQSQSTDKFQNLAQAYEILKDPIKRKKYDLKLASIFNPNVDHLNQGRNSSTPTTNPNRSSTYELFGYPGQTPQYVPSSVSAPRPASAAPIFRFRQASQPRLQTNNNNNSSLADSNIANNLSPSAHSASRRRSTSTIYPDPHQSSSHQPFTQKINLKDLDSLDLTLNKNFPSNHIKSIPRNNESHDLSSTNSHYPMSTSAPNPYLTFERAWGKSLDEIVQQMASDRSPSTRPHSKSNLPPLQTDRLKPGIVHRSSTVRSDNSDYRSTSFDQLHNSRPRSAAGDPIRDRNLNRHSHSVPIQHPATRREQTNEAEPYLGSSLHHSHHPRHRRMSTTGHYHPEQIYRPSSNTLSTSPSSGLGGVGMRNRTVSPISASTTTSSPHDYAGSSSSCHHQHHHAASAGRSPSRSRAATTNDYYPLDHPHPHQKRTPSGSLSRQFQEVIIRFERERDGSTRMSKEFKSRTIDVDGTVHDRYRRQRAAVVK